ncbi:MAG: CDP-glycerol glycerophosphotransferase family protein [Desulfobulbaceae bacterium]|nr:CDP-glycerol glycerophosphotransferase family protein [Desulfobulbaceae bacterium]
MLKNKPSSKIQQKKIAFLVHEPMMLVHYTDVWKALNPNDFTILLTKNFSYDIHRKKKLGVSEFFYHTSTEGYEVREVTEIIKCKIKFDYVVTNHFISRANRVSKHGAIANFFCKIRNLILLLPALNKNKYLPQQVGNKQIRFMYGADISNDWSLQNWNDIYDVFLCHGVNDEREIKKRFKGKTFIMGYPRYDRFFSAQIDLTNIKREFRLSESKKTLLWMPTLGGDCSSIPLFAEALSKINQKYDIIVRPHPLSFYQEKKFIHLLEKYNFKIDRNALRDMNELFSAADVVLADNGGTPFSAIFLGKNLIFLNVPDDIAAESAATSFIVGSSVLDLKKKLPVVHNQEIDRLETMINSEDFYKKNDQEVEMLFKKYFNSPRGGGAKRVADILSSL